MNKIGVRACNMYSMGPSIPLEALGEEEVARGGAKEAMGEVEAVVEVEEEKEVAGVAWMIEVVEGEDTIPTAVEAVEENKCFQEVVATWQHLIWHLKGVVIIAKDLGIAGRGAGKGRRKSRIGFLNLSSKDGESHILPRGREMTMKLRVVMVGDQ
jgi:hypothetical protein